MNDESKEMSNDHAPAPQLAEDFALQTIDAIKRARKRRMVRRSIASTGCLGLLICAIVIAGRMKPEHQTLAARNPSPAPSWPHQSPDLAMAKALAQAGNPAGIGDYFLPSTGTLVTFSSDYAGLNNEPYWSDDYR